jgi:FO synthase
MHIHAFSTQEVWEGARSLGLPVESFLEQLKMAGLNSLPGTAAEVLDDEVRSVICPDKVDTLQWIDVIECAHRAGLKTTATIMFGHVDRLHHWARHLLRIRDLQMRTGGFTEFVPLPFVPDQTPAYLEGIARKGPTFRECVLMHSVARLVLHGQIANIQTSWVKMGEKGVLVALHAGANDVGGTLMNESITKSAGATNGQEKTPGVLENLILSIERRPRQRTTLYGDVTEERVQASYGAKEIHPVINTPLREQSSVQNISLNR